MTFAVCFINTNSPVTAAMAGQPGHSVQMEDRHTKVGQGVECLGGLVNKHLPVAQVMIPGGLSPS